MNFHCPGYPSSLLSTVLRNRIQELVPIRFAFRISLLANLYTGSVYREVAARHGIARSEYLILFCLKLLGELTAQDIVEITGRPKNSISRAVTAMVDRGFVSRRVDPDNGRRAPMLLTRAGEEIYDATVGLFQDCEAAMLATLDAEERATLDGLLDKLARRDDAWERLKAV
jgi:DNA-binding MarR family transcriptional regulator